MDFDTAIKNLNKTLEKKQPKILNSSWIHMNALSSYQYIQKNIRTESDAIDWDTVTKALDRSFAKRWVRYRHKQAKPYEKQSEIEIILTKYKDKIYTFLSPADDQDKKIQDKIVISLVRLGQKGNICAQEELIKWVSFITDDWIDRYPQMYRWRGHTDEVPDKIRGCIRCYRYTGSFLGYLFKTLEYSARGKPPLVSLDDNILDGSKTRIDFVIYEE